jgi:MoaA/NifB/PqqE/SkfB family radical SAM enzyme
MKSKAIIKTCHWEITKKCNLNCLHCISSTGNKRELNEGSALKMINILKNWGCNELYFTGGEPLIRQDIFNLFKKAKENKMKIGVLSNGILINNKNIKQIKNYVEELGISLDGASSKTNDLIRGENTFGKIINAINLAKKYEIPVTLYFTLCRLNISDFENILEIVKSLKIDNIRVNEISLRGRAYKNRKILGFNKQEVLGLKQDLLSVLKKFNYQKKDFWFYNSCEINDKNVFISPQGYAYPCIEVYQRKPSYHFGNILKSSKEEFELRRNKCIKLKPKNCPYLFAVKNDLALCFNNQSIKCRLCF